MKKFFQDRKDNFYISQPPVPGKVFTENHRNISTVLRTQDEFEYFSETDSFDLFKKEELFLEFNQVPGKELGLQITFRQTLLTTFLLYSGLSYMGDKVGDYFAKIETQESARNLLGNPFKMLGGIQCFVYDEHQENWELIEELYETGPIAKNAMIIPLPKQDYRRKKIKMKLKMARGLWRIDAVGLSRIIKQVNPIEISPNRVLAIEGQIDNPLQRILWDDQDHFLTLPGDEYHFEFKLPNCHYSENHELFLLSKGYYLEWIRQRWLEGKNLKKLRKMLLQNPNTWRELALEYKSMEAGMECEFWNTKYSKIQ